MFAVSRPATRCHYCAFRSQQLRLQAQRHRSTGRQRDISISYHSPKNANSNKTNRRSSRARRDDGGDDSKIRKFYAEGNDPHPKINSMREGINRRNEKKNFAQVLPERLKAMKEELKHAPMLKYMRKEKEDEGGQVEEFPKIWAGFEKGLVKQGHDFVDAGDIDESVTSSAMKGLREAYQIRGAGGLDDRIKYAFYGHVLGSRFTKSDIKNQTALADLRYPIEWYPATRATRRTIHLHIGPTNSGKTYHALQRLEQAEKGVYAGPLRLLAHEVYTRMNAKGKSCSLVTGEERRFAEEGSLGDMSACTVEMMPTNKTLDVAVIDEIQMIGNSERGWAWTSALLGVKAKEVHLCGEERTLDLIRELCAAMGEKLEVHRYKRLSPLQVADRSLDGSLKRLRKGDCIVSFSVMGIHALRRQIEKDTGRKVATVYGSLPPETRAQQARLFNDPDNDYDFLVASDAVGMGLNLAIKRVIFESASKFDGVQRRTLAIADIKQIGGRAGRYRTAHQANQAAIADQDLSAAKGETHADVSPRAPRPQPQSEENMGYVTTLERFDFPVVKAAMDSQPEPIRTAGIFPPAPVLERFASYFPPGTPFSFILTRLHELSQMHKRFHLCGLKDHIWLADLIEPVENLSVSDRNTICASPASKSDMDLWRVLMPAYARCIAEQTGGSLVDIEELPLEILEQEVSPNRTYLRELERLHKGIVTYLWLSYRFAGVFSTRALAFHAKGMVEGKIEEVLDKFSFTEAQRRKIAERRAKQTKQMNELLPKLDVEGNQVLDDQGYPVYDRKREGADAAGAEGKDVETEEDENDAVDRNGQYLAAQTSLTAGGDHFGGEDDVDFLEPEGEDVDKSEEAPPLSSSFSEWRARQTRGESQGSKEEEDEVAELDDLASTVQDTTNMPTKRDVSTDAITDEEASHKIEGPFAPAGDPAMPLAGIEQTTALPESELETAEPPLASQVAPPNAFEDNAESREEEVEAVAKPTPVVNKTEEDAVAGSGETSVPHKHLEKLDAHAKGTGTEARSRP